MNQKKQLAVLAVLLLIAGFIWFFYFDHNKPVVTPDASTAAQNYQPIGVDNPQLHLDQVEKGRKAEHKSRGRNIFSRDVPPPPPPTLPAKFFGYGTIPNGTARVAFFSDVEDVYVVTEGELLLNRFRILKIGNVNLEFEEVSSGRRGTANLEEQGASPSA